MNAVQKRYSLILMVIVATLINTSYAQELVQVWYGNLDSSPIEAEIGGLIDVNAYIQTSENAYIGDIHLCLGVQDYYISDFLSEEYGEFYYPFEGDENALFTPVFGSPPNSSGWSSQSFIGWSSDPPPWLHFDNPTRIFKMVIEAMDDPSIIGDTADCLGPGIHPTFGQSAVGDTLGDCYPLIESYSPIYFVQHTDIELTYEAQPIEFGNSQNFPNPFNASTTIRYTLPKRSHLTIDIYNILGQKVTTLLDISQQAGYHQVTWNAENRPSGVYFYKIQAGDYIESKRMVLLK